MFVVLVREFARRTAQEHRENLQPAHSQLRVINSIARETLVATSQSTRLTTARARQIIRTRSSETKRRRWKCIPLSLVSLTIAMPTAYGPFRMTVSTETFSGTR